MHHAKKDSQWRFGMRAHIQVDAASGVVHSLIGSARNGADILQAHRLLHGQEHHAHGGAGYQDVEKREVRNPHQAVPWQNDMCPGKRRKLPDTESGRFLNDVERGKSRLRANFEHPFHIIKKKLFRHRVVNHPGPDRYQDQSKRMHAYGRKTWLDQWFPKPTH